MDKSKPRRLRTCHTRVLSACASPPVHGPEYGSRARWQDIWIDNIRLKALEGCGHGQAGVGGHHGFTSAPISSHLLKMV